MHLPILGQRDARKMRKKKAKIMLKLCFDSQNNATLILENALFYFK